MDQQRFDDLARLIGDRQTRRMAIKALAGMTLGLFGIRANGSSAEATVLPCTLICPPNVNQSNDPSQCGAVVTYPLPTFGGICGPVVCAPPSGTFFPVGSTPITCSDGGLGVCGFTVTVTDMEAPTITCPADIVVEGTPDAVVNFAPPSASDNCPGVSSFCNPPSGSTFPPGVSIVQCQANDTAQGVAGCGFLVTVLTPTATAEASATPDPTTDPGEPTSTATTEPTLAGTTTDPSATVVPTGTAEVDGVTQLPSTGTSGDDSAVKQTAVAALLATGAAAAAALGLRATRQAPGEEPPDA